MVDKQHRRGIQSFTLYDVDDAYAPPEKPVLVISVIEDVVCLSIRKGDPEDGQATESVAEITVDTASLSYGLQAAMRADQLIAIGRARLK